MYTKKNSCRGRVYLHELKELKARRWGYWNVCTLFPQTEEGYEAFTVVLGNVDYETCEMWKEREEDG